ncbi:MAG: glycoside hydrolase family 13 protein [Burkholderiales bacterium]
MRAISGHQRHSMPQAGNACASAPLPNRDVFVRGSFNSWNAHEDWRMSWRCDHYELIASPKGEHQFKMADDDWSPDADWGRPVGFARGIPANLQARGAPIEHQFSGGPVRFHLSFPNGKEPQFRMSDCQAKGPFGDSQLFLRGTMNNWAALDDYAMRWHCDAYVLNIDVKGRHDFKIGDAGWSKPSIIASNSKGEAVMESQGGTGNLTRTFNGEHTLTLRFDAQGRASLNIGPKTFTDATEAAITDKAALGLSFDSRQAAFKAPFGAQPVGSEFVFTVHSKEKGLKRVTLVIERRELTGNQEKLDYLPLARVEMKSTEIAQGSRVEGRFRFDQPAIYGYWFEVETAEGMYALQNNKDSIYWTREKGSMGPAVVERMPESQKRIRRYRQTIHLADLRVPDWSADVVYYYLFPERFRNGNKANDPVPGRDRYQSHTVETHAKWLERPYRPGESGDAVYNNDFFGGDLEGIISKLDDIKQLGANTLYMTPVLRAPSNHKYDTADFKQIDPAFGTTADFKRLTAEAAKRGMRVIPDTSLNHVGSDSPYFDRFGNYGGKTGAFAGGKPNPASPYFNWFVFDTTQTDPNKQYQGWVGVADLPELNKDSEAWRKFAFRDPDSVTRYWLQQGASGWRMDVAPWVNDSFWREWSAVVKQENPQALTVAETWFDASKYFLGDMFDSTMNYIFRNAVLDFAAGGKAANVVANLELTREAYPAPMLHAAMNLLSTHDQARALHAFGIHGNPHTDVGIDPQKLSEAKQRLLLAVFFQMSFPGAPTVYYGDEVGVGGGEDPFNRATYPWADEGGKPDLQLRSEFQRLIGMRNQHPVLRRGSLKAPLLVTNDLIVFERELKGQKALVFLSNRSTPQVASVPASGRFLDALNGSTTQAENGKINVEVPALFGRVLLSQ